MYSRSLRGSFGCEHHCLSVPGSGHSSKKHLRQFSNMVKLMSSLSCHLWCKKKKSSPGHHPGTETFGATEGYFLETERLSGVIVKRQFVITSSCQGLPRICTLYITQRRKHNIQYVSNKGQLKTGFSLVRLLSILWIDPQNKVLLVLQIFTLVTMNTAGYRAVE